MRRNFDSYFGTLDPAWVRSAEQARYGLSAAGFGYRWHEVDPRFDLSANPNEPNRFGWVVEIDPFDPKAKPVKRTALGRVKHEGATVAESRGRVVVYCGDDQDGDYLYKFVSSAPWRRLRRRRGHRHLTLAVPAGAPYGPLSAIRVPLQAGG